MFGSSVLGSLFFVRVRLKADTTAERILLKADTTTERILRVARGVSYAVSGFSGVSYVVSGFSRTRT